MNVETLIYAYLAICASMIVFNCVCIVTFQRSETNIHKTSVEFGDKIARQIELVEQGRDPDEKHKEYLSKKLKRTGNLMALSETLKRLLAEKPDSVNSYLEAIHPIFIYLAMEYRHKDNLKAAYYFYMIKEFRILKGRSVDPIIDILLEFLHDPSLYCRENALQAIYSTGSFECVVNALQVIDTGEHFHHSKLLSDGLLAFDGDHDMLSSALWEVFGDFSTQMKVTLLNYFRFSTSNCCEEMMQLMTDESQDDEIRFSCIRYFGKYHYDPAYSFLLDFAGNTDGLRWEYAAIASSALAIYPTDRAAQVLKNNLYSSNWYIRFNSSLSLEKFGLTYTDMIDIFDGNDRYAREILQYRLDQRNARRKESVTV